MSMNENDSFAQFLEWPEDKRIEYMKKHLHWWERPCIWFVNKWWTNVREANRDLPGHILFESIRKGRF